MIIALLTDIIVIILHILFGHYRVFNLDAEHNLPTLYQGFKLLILATLCFIPIITAYINQKPLKRLLSLWIPFYLIFTWLTLDELGQFHENIKQFADELMPQASNTYTNFFTSRGYGSTEWVILYIPLFIIFFAYLIYALKHLKNLYGKKIWIPSIIGVFFYVCVIALEVIGMNQIPILSFDKAILLEESFEMVGTSLIGISIFNIAYKEVQALREKNTLQKTNYNINSKTLKIMALIIFCTLAILGFQLYKKPSPKNDTQQLTENTYKPSRNPQNDCVWKEELRSRLGVKFFFEDCSKQINIFIKSETIYTIPEKLSAGGTISDYKQIQVLQKPEDQPIQDSIYLKFLEQLTLEQKETCKVIKENYKLEGNEVYRIFPDLDYAKDSHIAQYISCGPYSITESNGFFLYNQDKKQKYLYVYEDNGVSVIDKETIQIL